MKCFKEKTLLSIQTIITLISIIGNVNATYLVGEISRRVKIFVAKPKFRHFAPDEFSPIRYFISCVFYAVNARIDATAFIIRVCPYACVYLNVYMCTCVHACICMCACVSICTVHFVTMLRIELRLHLRTSFVH